MSREPLTPRALTQLERTHAGAGTPEASHVLLKSPSNTDAVNTDEVPLLELAAGTDCCGHVAAAVQARRAAHRRRSSRRRQRQPWRRRRGWAGQAPPPWRPSLNLQSAGTDRRRCRARILAGMWHRFCGKAALTKYELEEWMRRRARGGRRRDHRSAACFSEWRHARKIQRSAARADPCFERQVRFMRNISIQQQAGVGPAYIALAQCRHQ
jgi:hypothetical protein